MRYNSVASKLNYVYNDFVYGFFLSRPAENALHDKFRTLLKGQFICLNKGGSCMDFSQLQFRDAFFWFGGE
jgi:hypothetical protein